MSKLAVARGILADVAALLNQSKEQ
jgi:hypothetical protein